MNTTLEELRRLTLQQQAEQTKDVRTGQKSPGSAPGAGGAKAILTGPTERTVTSAAANDGFVSRVRRRVAGTARKSDPDDRGLSLALAARAKAYCRDHGDLPVRLLLLALIETFLDDAGY